MSHNFIPYQSIDGSIGAGSEQRRPTAANFLNKPWQKNAGSWKTVGVEDDWGRGGRECGKISVRKERRIASYLIASSSGQLS